MLAPSIRLCMKRSHQIHSTGSCCCRCYRGAISPIIQIAILIVANFAPKWHVINGPSITYATYNKSGHLESVGIWQYGDIMVNASPFIVSKMSEQILKYTVSIDDFTSCSDSFFFSQAMSNFSPLFLKTMSNVKNSLLTYIWLTRVYWHFPQQDVVGMNILLRPLLRGHTQSKNIDSYRMVWKLHSQ